MSLFFCQIRVAQFYLIGKNFVLPKSSDKKCHSALDAESSSLIGWIPAFAGMSKLLVLAILSLAL
ncbi:MAG: hypothetical protein Q8O60_07820, partial [Deltaproteobacteria bacterium]|nr:hypothetical protein [Deltaproteobacteria bacterium]